VPDLKTAGSEGGLTRTVVIGTSCSGKTNFARQLAARLDAHHIELDRLYWLPGWQARAYDEFREKVLAATDAKRWIVDGNYSKVRDITWRRATAVVWLDYPFPVIFKRALIRSIRRIVTGEELFAGNRETFKKTFLSRESILWWVMTTYRRRRREYPQLFGKPEHNHLKVHRISKPVEARSFLEGISSG
jgi:adenylate kinase family enzyme